MSLLDKAKKFFDMSSVALSALELVGDIAKGELGSRGTSAVELLELIAKIVEKVKAGFDGTVSAADIKAEIAKMRSDIAANDAAADAAVDEKFPKGEP
jgi:hypothetical protein